MHWIASSINDGLVTMNESVVCARAENEKKKFRQKWMQAARRFISRSPSIAKPVDRSSLKGNIMWLLWCSKWPSIVFELPAVAPHCARTTIGPENMPICRIIMQEMDSLLFWYCCCCCCCFRFSYNIFFPWSIYGFRWKFLMQPWDLSGKQGDRLQSTTIAPAIRSE